VPAITSLGYDADATEAIVVTRIPNSLFDYEAANASVAVSGAVALNLAGQERRLGGDTEGRTLQAGGSGDERASFSLEVSLGPENTVVTAKRDALSSSAAARRGHAAIIGIIFGFAYSLW